MLYLCSVSLSQSRFKNKLLQKEKFLSLSLFLSLFVHTHIHRENNYFAYFLYFSMYQEIPCFAVCFMSKRVPCPHCIVWAPLLSLTSHVPKRMVREQQCGLEWGCDFWCTGALSARIQGSQRGFTLLPILLLENLNKTIPPLLDIYIYIYSFIVVYC